MGTSAEKRRGFSALFGANLGKKMAKLELRGERRQVPLRRLLYDLVAKVPRSHRWKVSPRGRHLLGLAVQLYRCSWPQLAA